MATILSSYRFLEATREDEVYLQDNLRWSQLPKEHLRVEMVYLATKVCVSGYPRFSTAAGGCALKAMHWIFDVIRCNNWETEEFHLDFFQFMIECIRAGPTSTHLEMLDIIYRNGDFKTFLKNLSDVKLKTLISTLTKEFRPENDPDTTPDCYSSWLLDFLRGNIFRNISKDQVMLVLDEVSAMQTLYLKKSRDKKEPEKIAKVYEYILADLDKYQIKELEENVMMSSDDPFGLTLMAKDVADDTYIKDNLKEIRGRLGKHNKTARCSKTSYIKAIPNVFHLLKAVSQCEFNENRKNVIKEIIMFFPRNNNDERHEFIKDDHGLFEDYITKMTNLCDAINDYRLLACVISDFSRYFLASCSKLGDSKRNKSIQQLVAKYCGVLVSKPTKGFAEAADYMIETYKDIMRWKGDSESARPVFIGLNKLLETYTNMSDDDREYWTGSKLGDFTEDFMKTLKMSRVIGEFQEEMFNFSIVALKSGSKFLFPIAMEISKFVELKKHKNRISEFLSAMIELLNQDYDFEKGWCMRIVMDLMNACFEACDDGSQLAPFNESFIILYKEVMARDYIDYSNGNKNINGVLIQNVVLFFAKHKLSNTLEATDPLLEDVLRLLGEDDEDITNSMKSVLDLIAYSKPVVLVKHINRLLDLIINEDRVNLLQCVSLVYKEDHETIDLRLEELFGVLNKSSCEFLRFLDTICDTNPKKVKKEDVDHVVNTFFLDPMYSGMLHSMLLKLAQKYVEPISDSTFDRLCGAIESSTITKSIVPFTLVYIVLNSEKSRCQKYADKAFKVLIACLTQNISDGQRCLLLIGVIRILGADHKDLLATERSFFEDLARRHVGTAETVQGIIDVIEGRSLEGLSKTVENQQDEIEELDTRVTATEDDVEYIYTEVKQTKEDVQDVTERVDEAEYRLDYLDEHVEDIEEKVEAIDMKTVSNAPAWSKQVSLLMNPELEHDWRLLAQRLGYTPDDIRGWATQHDPCMSLLSEWFATHKTSEAIHAVFEALVEMDRMDAALIVEEAMKNVEDIVLDEPPEYSSPPPIFLSYQWGHQPEVKLLRKHLKMAGFECWMDIGQMGGGDKLFEKIDQGIRSAKVVVCCVTEKYAKSPNCIREVNLSVSLGKSIIPILLESVAWPPAGSMGPIFSEYLYIRMFLGQGKQGREGRSWGDEKFTELLMQLSFNKLIPDPDLIATEYLRWWEPAEEEIIIPQRENNTIDHNTDSKKSSEIKEKCPEVFLSYQWGKQPLVKKLYRRLTEKGFSCWLDIHQMGGGDSLYDKIDNGIRNCSVVVSCVTDKYSKSPNCRREVSLADALKKPIIPLLLEQTTWPPLGPMSMVFTQLLYIDFSHVSDLQDVWTGDRFNELMSNLRLNIPGISDEAQQVPELTLKAAEPGEEESDTVSKIDENFEQQNTPHENHSPQSIGSMNNAIELEGKSILTTIDSSSNEESAAEVVPSFDPEKSMTGDHHPDLCPSPSSSDLYQLDNNNGSTTPPLQTNVPVHSHGEPESKSGDLNSVENANSNARCEKSQAKKSKSCAIL